MRKERTDASGTWQRQALHAHSPAAGCWRCVPGPCGADGTSQEPQEPQSTHSQRGLAHPDCPPREPLEGPHTLQGLRHSLWVQSGVNCWGPAGPGSSRQPGGGLVSMTPEQLGNKPALAGSPHQGLLGPRTCHPECRPAHVCLAPSWAAASPLGIRRPDAIGTLRNGQQGPLQKGP